MPGWTCKAFPEGIPEAILNRAFDHSEAVGIDKGITYKSKEFKGANTDNENHAENVLAMSFWQRHSPLHDYTKLHD